MSETIAKWRGGLWGPLTSSDGDKQGKGRRRAGKGSDKAIPNRVESAYPRSADVDVLLQRLTGDAVWRGGLYRGREGKGGRVWSEGDLKVRE